LLTLREERRQRLFENRVLRGIYGQKRNGVREKWRKLYNEEFNVLYFSQNIVQVIKSRRMRWVGHVACLGRREAYTGFWWGNLRERDHLGDSGANRRIILEWIFRMWGVDWIELAQDRDRWQALVKAVVNL
jgi:hypothetical protein